MATVRFNQELRGKIMTNADRQMQPAIRRADELIPGPEWGPKVYAIMFQRELPLIQQAPDNWFKYKSEIDIRGFKAGDSTSVTFKLPAPVRWPETVVENEFIRPGRWSTTAELKPHPVWDELVAAYTVYKDAVEAAKARALVYRESVAKIIETYSTVAPALKAWPPLWDLLPTDTQDAHNRATESQKRAEKDPGVDLDVLTAISTAVKFGI